MFVHVNLHKVLFHNMHQEQSIMLENVDNMEITHVASAKEIAIMMMIVKAI